MGWSHRHSELFHSSCPKAENTECDRPHAIKSGWLSGYLLVCRNIMQLVPWIQEDNCICRSPLGHCDKCRDSGRGRTDRGCTWPAPRCPHHLQKPKDMRKFNVCLGAAWSQILLFIAYLTCTFKLLCRRGEEQFTLHPLWAGTASDPRFFVSGFDPVREPSQVAVTVQRVGTNRSDITQKNHSSVQVLSFWCSTLYKQQVSLQLHGKRSC